MAGVTMWPRGRKVWISLAYRGAAEGFVDGRSKEAKQAKFEEELKEALVGKSPSTSSSDSSDSWIGVALWLPSLGFGQTVFSNKVTSQRRRVLVFFCVWLPEQQALVAVRWSRVALWAE